MACARALIRAVLMKLPWRKRAATELVAGSADHASVPGPGPESAPRVYGAEEPAQGSSIDKLRWSLQALALPAQEQVGLFPPFVWVGDELASDFDEWRQAASSARAFTPDQLSALASVDAALQRMTDENNMEFWEAPDHPRWQEVRERAEDALRHFQWSLETPPKNRAIYVGPP